MNENTNEFAKKIDQIFSGDIEFVFGSAKPGDLPQETLPEIAFVGKSNSGKSSLINLITNRKSLSRVSNTPGRTKQINFFKVRNLFYLVDLPGFGYAKVSKKEHQIWEKLILKYLNSRNTLRIIVFIIDSRRGILENDRQVINILQTYNIPFCLVFSKIDKLKSGELENFTSNLAQNSEVELGKQLLMASLSNIDFTQFNEFELKNFFLITNKLAYKYSEITYLKSMLYKILFFQED